MALASIHIESKIASNSEAHNSRATAPDYLLLESDRDEPRADDQWVVCSIAHRREQIKAGAMAASPSGRPLRSDARPIREGVVNLEEHHTMEDLHRLAAAIKSEIGIDAFQMYIHRDEGRYVDPENDRTVEPGTSGSMVKHNYHGHMIFDYLDYDTGKKLKPSLRQLSQLQDIVAEQLDMERGQTKSKSGVKRLGHLDYKLQQREMEVVEAKAESVEIVSAAQSKSDEITSAADARVLAANQQVDKAALEVAVLRRKKKNLFQMILEKLRIKLEKLLPNSIVLACLDAGVSIPAAEPAAVHAPGADQPPPSRRSAKRFKRLNDEEEEFEM